MTIAVALDSHPSSFFRLSVAALFCTVCLVTLGGIVHNTGSSLACPDWPLCFGQVFPKMEGKVAVEHSHRLLATFTGLLTIGLVILGSREKHLHPDLFRGSLLALGLVVFQGILGGITVLLKLSTLVSVAHLGTSQLFIAVLCWLSWRSRPRTAFRLQASALLPSEVPRRLKLAVGVLYTQILWGAMVRHSGAGGVCGLGSDAMFLCTDVLTMRSSFWPSFAQAQFHMGHRYLAIFTLCVVVWSTLPLLKWARAHQQKKLRVLCVTAHTLVTFQIAAGLATVADFISVPTVTLHLVLAMLLWLTMLSLRFLAEEMARPRKGHLAL